MTTQDETRDEQGDGNRRQESILRPSRNDDGTAATTCPRDVFADEIEEISKRRRNAGLDADVLAEPEEAPLCPDPKLGLVGLAISGGGIRSATFSLGVVQALERAGVFRYVDYLSTVSGGGYTGAMLSSSLDSAKRCATEEFSVRKRVGEKEPVALQHLRNGSNYLNSGGPLASLRLPMLLLRGLLLNALALTPFLICAVFLTEFLYEQRFFDIAGLTSSGLTFEKTPIAWGLVPFLAFIVAFPLLTRLLAGRIGWRGRNRLEMAMSAAFGFSLLTLVGVPALFLVQGAIELPWHGPDGLEGYYHRVGRWHLELQGIALALVGANVAALAKVVGDVARIAARVLFYSLGVVGVAGLFGAYLLLCVAQIDSPFISKDFAGLLDRRAEGALCSATAEDCQAEWQNWRDFTTALARKGICPLEDCAHGTLVPVTPEQRAKEWEAWKSDAGNGVLARSDVIYRADASAPLDLARVAKCTGAADTTWVVQLNQHSSSSPEEACGWSGEKLEGSGYVQVVDLGQKLEIRGAKLRLWGEPSEAVLLSDFTFFGIGIALLLYLVLFFDVNRTSLHSFYRDRLSRLYLFRLDDDGELRANDKVKLSELNPPGSSAPYHLINTALNLQSDPEARQRGRQAGFFLLSKRHSGSEHTGYCPTPWLERRDRHLDLGTAMAISGAAAAPNMGTLTSSRLTLIMALLNIRLSYWLPNPDLRFRKRSYALSCPGLLYLLREGFSWLHERAPYVNLSDGGHLENLGVFELLRRRCALIIAIDGEEDREYRFHGLMTLQRYAKIDLGVDIDIDVEPLVPTGDGPPEEQHSQVHAVWGTIDYGRDHEGRERIGQLLYIKASVTGDEEPFVTAYRREHSAFPHESTADQFFDEEQFEVYRNLGEHIGGPLAEEAKRHLTIAASGAPPALRPPLAAGHDV